jgi:ComF family protein
MIKKYLAAFLHLWYPHICLHCGTDQLENDSPLCLHCTNALPFTDFFSMQNNPIEKIFWGRTSVLHAGAALFFTKESIVQKLIFELKYKYNKKAGLLLGRIMGNAMKNSVQYENISLLIPIPITSKKLRKRGFNQAQVLCEGIRQVWDKKMATNLLLKKRDADSQTHKDRLERGGQNSFQFYLKAGQLLENENVLLIDDVITTGATLEAACNCLEVAMPASINIATAAYTL